jgi:hypothetical protein
MARVFPVGPADVVFKAKEIVHRAGPFISERAGLIQTKDSLRNRLDPGTIHRVVRSMAVSIKSGAFRPVVEKLGGLVGSKTIAEKFLIATSTQTGRMLADEAHSSKLDWQCQRA